MNYLPDYLSVEKASKAWSPCSRKDPRTCLQPCSQESFIFFNISIAKISHEGSIPCSHYNHRYGYQAKFSNHVRKHLLGIFKTKRKPGLRNHELSVGENSLLFHVSVRNLKKNLLKIEGFLRVSPNINPTFRPVILVALFPKPCFEVFVSGY